MFAISQFWLVSTGGSLDHLPCTITTDTPDPSGLERQALCPLECSSHVRLRLRHRNRPDVFGPPKLFDRRLRRIFRIGAGIIRLHAQHPRRATPPVRHAAVIQTPGHGVGMYAAGNPLHVAGPDPVRLYPLRAGVEGPQSVLAPAASTGASGGPPRRSPHCGECKIEWGRGRRSRFAYAVVTTGSAITRCSISLSTGRFSCHWFSFRHFHSVSTAVWLRKFQGEGGTS